MGRLGWLGGETSRREEGGGEALLPDKGVHSKMVMGSFLPTWQRAPILHRSAAVARSRVSQRRTKHKQISPFPRGNMPWTGRMPRRHFSPVPGAESLYGAYQLEYQQGWIGKRNSQPLTAFEITTGCYRLYRPCSVSNSLFCRVASFRTHNPILAPLLFT